MKKYIILNATSRYSSIYCHSFCSSSVISSKSLPVNGSTLFYGASGTTGTTGAGVTTFVFLTSLPLTGTSPVLYGNSTLKKSSPSIKVSGLTSFSTILSLLSFLVISSILPELVSKVQSKSGSPFCSFVSLKI